MDAASKFKSYMVAFATCFGMASFVHSDDADATSPNKSTQCQTVTGRSTPCAVGVCCVGPSCQAELCPTAQSSDVNTIVCDAGTCDSSTSKTGIAAFVSDWLLKSPKFSVGLAIHFGAAPLTQNTQSSDLPMVDLQVKRTPEVSNFEFDLSAGIARPMKFTERIPRIQLGEFVNDVIICGHRICSGNKCYEVKDEPISGTACDTAGDASVNGDAEEEQILVVPMAPPAPPGVDIANYDNGNSETEAATLLRNSGLSGVNISVPVTTVVDLLIAKTELSTRLEMTAQLMDERQMAMEHNQSLANRNATLSTQLAVAEARNQMSEALTANVFERAELAIKLATVESKSIKLQGSNNVVHTIQEDLSNIRRQIALLRRSPVPFAQSYVGKNSLQPYTPTALLRASQFTKDAEATCAGDEPDSEDATTVK